MIVRCRLMSIEWRRAERRGARMPSQAALSPDAVDRRAPGVRHINFQRHLARGVGGAGRAGIETADGDFDVVQQAFGQRRAVQMAYCPLAHGFAHRLIVVRGGYDCVGAHDLIVLMPSADCSIAITRAQR